jgi:uncharacterized membrane protein YkoI
MTVVKKNLAKCGVVLMLLGLVGPALAASSPVQTQALQLTFEQPSDAIVLAQADDDPYSDPGSDTATTTIRPREAAMIAKDAYPGSRVLKVKLLPSGLYAVTLRGQGRLTRVMVDAESGEIQ